MQGLLGCMAVAYLLSRADYKDVMFNIEAKVDHAVDILGVNVFADLKRIFIYLMFDSSQ